MVLMILLVSNSSSSTSFIHPYFDTCRAFYPFVEDHSVRLIGVEAQSSSTLTKGTKGVFHGMMSYFLQTSDGQIEDGQSISAGLNYPGVSPEQAFLKDIGRVEVRMATELEALQGFRMCARMEGIIPDLDTSHALLTTLEVARELGKGANVVLVRSPFSSLRVALPSWRGVQGVVALTIFKCFASSVVSVVCWKRGHGRGGKLWSDIEFVYILTLGKWNVSMSSRGGKKDRDQRFVEFIQSDLPLV